jgi:hypothetical protein
MSTSCMAGCLSLDTCVPVWPLPRFDERPSELESFAPSLRIYGERRSWSEERHIFEVAYLDGCSGDIHIRLRAEKANTSPCVCMTPASVSLKASISGTRSP